MENKKEKMIEEIRENLWENLRFDTENLKDSLLEAHYPRIRSMTESEIEKSWKEEFNLD